MNASFPPPLARNARRSLESGYQLDFCVGQRCLLQFDLGGQKYRSTIVGVEAYEYVITKLPMVPGIQSKLRPGSSLTIRLEHNGAVYGFHTEVVTAMTKPSPMLLFAYPQTVECIQLRRHKRSRCMLPAVLRAGDTTVSGLVTDVSVGGCRMVVEGRGAEGRLQVEAGDMVDLHLPFDPMRPEPVQAVVVNNMGLKRHNALGLSFSGDGFAKPLAHFIARLEGARAALEEAGMLPA